MTFSIGNELSDASPVKQQKSKYRGSGLGPGLNHSPALAWDDQGVKVWCYYLLAVIMTNGHNSICQYFFTRSFFTADLMLSVKQ